MLQKTESDDHHKLRYYGLRPSNYLVLDYESITDKTGAEKDLEFEVTNILNQSSKAKFSIKVAAFQNFKDSVRAVASRPVINSYPEEWVTLPFRAHNLAGNNAEFVLKAGDKDLDATNSRVQFRDNVEISFQLPAELPSSTTKTFIEDEIENLIVIDNNTFVAIRAPDFWVINCASGSDATTGKPTLNCANPKGKNGFGITG